MAYLICPECGAHNPPEDEQCRICQTSLAGVEPVEEPAPPEGGEEELGLFNEEEHDLPDLLQGLKLEDIEYEIDPEGLPEINLDDDLDSGEETGRTPEWLDAVRKRAQVEDDSVGDLIKRVEAAQESVSGEGQENHNDFESWIQKLRDEARDEAAGNAIAPEEPEEPVEPAEPGDEAEPIGPEPEPAPEPEPEPGEDHSDWLTRIRKAHGIVDPDEGPNAASRSLLDWLVALEDNAPGEEETPATGDETREIETGWEGLPHEDITRQIKVVLEPRVTPQALNLTREESDQADLLSTIITDEKADHPVARRTYKMGVQWLNMLFLLILVTGISLALFTGGAAGLAQPQPSTGASALMAWVDELPEDADLLLVFDYQPAYASEMSLVAEPILTRLADQTDQTDQIYVASSVASGPLLADELFAGVGLTYTDVGYFPMASYGAFGVATGLSTGQTAPGLPKPAQAMLGREYDAVLVLSDNFEGAQTWIEQIAARAPETPLGVLATSQAAPLLQPYFESGQIVGVLSGFSDAVALGDLSDSESDLGPRWRAYQVGVLILMVTLILGAVIAPAKRSSNRPRGGK